MQVSYTFHISSKQHAITTTKQLSTASKHNLRKYSSRGNLTGHYDSDKIVQLAGTDNLFRDVEKVYHEQFDQALYEYNSKQKRQDRKIPDYMRYVSENAKSDLAVEAIIQLGDQEFWDRIPDSLKYQMVYIFRDQLNALRQYLPEFVIANAVIHFDEASPHMHVIGVPVSSGYKRGLSKQCAKTKVFTKESLEILQNVLRVRAEIGMEKNPEIFHDAFLKEKETGRNIDYSKEYYVQRKKEELEEVEQKLSEKRPDLAEIEEEDRKAQVLLRRLESDRRDLEGEKQEVESLKEDLTVLKNEVEKLSDLKCPFDIGDQFEIDGEMATVDYIYEFDRTVLIRTRSGGREIPTLDAIRAYNTFLKKKELTDECRELEEQIDDLKRDWARRTEVISKVDVVWSVFRHFPAIEEFVYEVGRLLKRSFQPIQLTDVIDVFKEKVLGIPPQEQERTRSRSR